MAGVVGKFPFLEKWDAEVFAFFHQLLQPTKWHLCIPSLLARYAKFGLRGSFLSLLINFMIFIKKIKVNYQQHLLFVNGILIIYFTCVQLELYHHRLFQ